MVKIRISAEILSFFYIFSRFFSTVENFKKQNLILYNFYFYLVMVRAFSSCQNLEDRQKIHDS